MNLPNRVRCFVEVDGLLHKIEHMNMEIKCHSPNGDYPDVVIEGCLSKKTTKNSKSIKKSYIQ